MDGNSLGKTIIAVGVAIVVFGLLVLALSRLTGGRGAPLPGDIVIRRPGMVFYFPIITSLVASLILSLLFWLVSIIRK
jgi:hypothetical protein